MTRRLLRHNLEDGRFDEVHKAMAFKKVSRATKAKRAVPETAFLLGIRLATYCYLLIPIRYKNNGLAASAAGVEASEKF
jgi:hypothetical protein